MVASWKRLMKDLKKYVYIPSESGTQLRKHDVNYGWGLPSFIVEYVWSLGTLKKTMVVNERIEMEANCLCFCIDIGDYPSRCDKISIHKAHKVSISCHYNIS